MAKRKVLLTGASGSMGHEAFKELWRRRDKYDIVLLLLPIKHDKRLFKTYEAEVGIKSIPGKGVVESKNGELKIVWGDLTNYDVVLKAVEGVDHVLHSAALVAPTADHNPALAKKINLGSSLNIIKAIKEQPNGAECITMVSVGSVAVYGDRLPPVALIRAGDPIMPCIFDFYAVSKIAAERVLIESDIKHWVSIRQSYIAIPDAMSLMDPIMFHQPIEQRIEMCTKADAGYGLIQTLEQDLDSDFWCRVYNQSGGPSCRFIYLDYIDKMMRLLGIGDFRKVIDRNWFCLRNFHDAWFADAHILNECLGHWRETLQDHLNQVKGAAPWYVNSAKFTPKWMIKNFVMKRMANRKDGPLYWVKHPDEMPNRIKAFYGSLEKWKEMDGWDWKLPDPDAESHLLHYGYDDSKSVDDLTIEELKKAAEFRGGECLSDSYSGNRSEKLKWKCAFGHEFEASIALILLGGHWCPECELPPWNYDGIVKKNPFLAQAYCNKHDKDENNFYSEEDCLKETF